MQEREDNLRGSIYKRGKMYSVVISLGRDENGKRNQKWYSGFKTKKEAEAACAKIINEIETNNYIEPVNTTVADYMINWLETYVKINLRETTYSGYSTYVDKHINPRIGNVNLQKLQPIHIQNFYNHLITKGRLDGKGGLSGKSVVQIHRILSKALGQAYKLQLITKKPTDYVEVPKKERFKANVLSNDDILKLLEVCKDTDMYVPIVLAVNLGLRRGEVLGLKWSDIDEENMTISINTNLVVTNEGLKITKPKSESSIRTLLVSKSLIDILQNHKSEQLKYKRIFTTDYINHNLICCKPDGSFIHPGRFSHKFSNLLVKHNLTKIRFHDLRHTNATLMLKSNIPAKIASERLGHSTIGITMDLYSHVTQEMQREAMTELDKFIFDLED